MHNLVRAPGTHTFAHPRTNTVAFFSGRSHPAHSVAHMAPEGVALLRQTLGRSPSAPQGPKYPGPVTSFHSSITNSLWITFHIKMQCNLCMPLIVVVIA